MELKKCSKCGEEKARSEFSKDRSCRDGLDYECKSCNATSSLARCERNRGLGDRPSDKRCSKCGETKPGTGFGANSRAGCGLQSSCRACMAKCRRARRDKNRSGLENRPAIGSKLCSKCGETKPGTGFHKNTASADCLNWQCKACTYDYRGLVRAAAVDRLYSYHAGCECPDCPITDKSRMHVDHRNGDGKEERARLGAIGSLRRVVEIVDPTVDYCLRCKRCNSSKGRGLYCSLTREGHTSLHHAMPPRQGGTRRAIYYQPLPADTLDYVTHNPEGVPVCLTRS